MRDLEVVRSDAASGMVAQAFVPIPSVCVFYEPLTAVSNHGAVLAGTDNVPAAHGEPPCPWRAFRGKR
jgi:hypothetical protein